MAAAAAIATVAGSVHSSKMKENPIESLREPHDLSMPLDAVETACGHLFSGSDLDRMIAASTRTNATGQKIIPCSQCRRDVVEGSYKPNMTARRMIATLSEAGFSDPTDVIVAPYAKSDIQKLSDKVDQLTQVVGRLTYSVGALTHQVRDLTFMLGVQSIRLENMVNMSFCDMGLTLLPGCFGGHTMTDIANRGLTDDQVRQLDRITVRATEAKRIVTDSRSTT